MLKVKNQPNFDFGPVSTVGQTWDVQWVPIVDPDATVADDLRAGRIGAVLRRAVPPAGRVLVGRPDGLLPVDQRRTRRRGPGIRVQPGRGDPQADLRLADRERSRQSQTTSR